LLLTNELGIIQIPESITIPFLLLHLSQPLFLLL
jgi:hypothetical protein